MPGPALVRIRRVYTLEAARGHTFPLSAGRQTCQHYKPWKARAQQLGPTERGAAIEGLRGSSRRGKGVGGTFLFFINQTVGLPWRAGQACDNGLAWPPAGNTFT